MIRSVRCYSKKADPGFLSDLLARIDAIPERVAAQKKENELARTQVKANASKKANTTTPRVPHNVASSRSQNMRINVADHPLATFNDGSFAKNNRRGPNSNRTQQTSGGAHSHNRLQSRFGAKRTPTRRPPPKRKPLVQQDERGSKELVYGPAEPKLGATELFHARSSKLNHSVSARVASVSKEILLESKYPYTFPTEVVANAPTHANNFVLLNNYSTDFISNDYLHEQLESKVLGKMALINLDEAKVPKGLKDHAFFTRKNLQLNPTINAADKQRVFDAVSGIKPVSSLVAGCHWVRK
jgi:hypothetical protein